MKPALDYFDVSRTLMWAIEKLDLTVRAIEFSSFMKLTNEFIPSISKEKFGFIY
jgi:hypothetical protein